MEKDEKKLKKIRKRIEFYESQKSTKKSTIGFCLAVMFPGLFLIHKATKAISGLGLENGATLLLSICLFSVGSALIVGLGVLLSKLFHKFLFPKIKAKMLTKLHNKEKNYEVKVNEQNKENKLNEKEKEDLQPAPVQDESIIKTYTTNDVSNDNSEFRVENFEN